MQASLVLTVIGADKPGLVESISEVVSQLGGNWVESRMARLEGKFAGIVRVTIDSTRVDDLAGALGALQSRGLRVIAERADTGERISGRRQMVLDLVGGDRVGIVHDVSHVLAERRINVEDLKTECASAPMSGKSLFRASARLSVPDEVDLDELRRALEDIAGDLIVDITRGEDAADAAREE